MSLDTRLSLQSLKRRFREIVPKKPEIIYKVKNQVVTSDSVQKTFDLKVIIDSSVPNNNIDVPTYSLKLLGTSYDSKSPDKVEDVVNVPVRKDLVDTDYLDSNNNNVILVEECSSFFGLGIQDVDNVNFVIENCPNKRGFPLNTHLIESLQLKL